MATPSPLDFGWPDPEPVDPFVLEDPADPGAEQVPPETLRERAIAVLKTVYDPEIPLNVYDLGLIYELATDASGAIRVTMTLTAPGCPVAGDLVSEVHSKLLVVPGATRVRTELVWEPPWTRERLSEATLLELGLL
jgi:FeS assembly SUF system protein